MLYACQQPCLAPHSPQLYPLYHARHAYILHGHYHTPTYGHVLPCVWCLAMGTWSEVTGATLPHNSHTITLHVTAMVHVTG